MSKEPEALMGFFQPFVSRSEFPVGFLPGKASFNLETFLVNIFNLIKSFKLFVEQLAVFVVPGIGFNDRGQFVHLNFFMRSL